MPIKLRSPSDARNHIFGSKLSRKREPDDGSAKLTEAFIVVTVTVTDCVAWPFSVKELGETLQVEKVGAPEQFIVTFWLKPPFGLTVRL